MQHTRILTGLNSLRRPPPRAIVAVGMFDGVHIAHQKLIRTAVQLAKQRRGTSVVLTFDPDPQQVLNPEQAKPPLQPLELRLQLLVTLGVDMVWVIPFTKAFSKTTPERFLRTILLKRLHPGCVVVGENFAFGKDRGGTLAMLRRFGQQYGIRIMVIAPVKRDGQPVSSSRIRRLIQTGHLTQASRLLGRAIELRGTVVQGDKRARRLGFPTANVRLAHILLPPRGVYRVCLVVDDHRFPGLMNLGVRPTFGAGPLTCEVHLVGFRGRLYGRRIALCLLSRLRDERRFASSEALAQQIRRDLTQARLVRRSV